MASQTLRPHRSPSPSPAPAPTTPTTNQAKLTRQSLGPPTASTGAARGFSGLGISSNAFNAQPRHASSGVGLSPRPSMGSGLRSASGRPSSEFLPPRGDARTPEAEQIDQWFKHLASWEATLEEMAAASTDQNFTEELGAIEQWFRVLSEAERTAALYSLLQHSTPVQIRFFLSVLQHMAQSDPMTALLSPNPMSAGMQAQMDAKLVNTGLKSPSASYLEPEAQRNKLRQNRISAPGTLQPHDRWQGQLDQVVERGGSPMSDRSRSPTPEIRPQSTDFAGRGIGLGLAEPTSPIPNGSWASMTNTPLVPSFSDPKIDGRVNLEDARQFRRTGRNVSGHYNDQGEYINAGFQPGPSPILDQYPVGLGMDFANMSLNPMAYAQQLTAASFAQAGYGGLRGPAKPPAGRRSPMLGKAHSPTPDKVGGGGVAGPDDVDMRVIEDVSSWLRVLRLHKYTTTFEKIPWRDMIAMSENDLIAKGVSAQGARTKFLKVFYNVRTKFDLPHPAGSEAYAPAKDDK